MAPHLIGLSATTCMLLLALLVLRRGRGDLRLPIALLAFDLFIWNFAMLMRDITGTEAWRYIDNAFSPFTPALALHVVLAFVGRLRPLGWVAVLMYVGGAALAVVSLFALVSPAAAAWVASAAQSVVFLSLLVPAAILMGVVLVIHLRRQVREDERMRTRLLLASLVLGAGFGSTESWDEFLPVPALGHFGALLMALLIAMVVLRLPSRIKEAPARTTAYAFGLALIGVTGCLIIVRVASTNIAVAVVVGAVLVAGLAAALAELLGAWRKRQAQRTRLAFLGRLSEQLAHDLLNPLAAAYGAVEVLEEQARRDGEDDPTRVALLATARGQLARIDETVRRYQRFSGCLHPERVAVAELLERVVSRRFGDAAKARGIVIERAIDPALPIIAVDEEQLGQALEDVLRNAFEAMPEGGTLRLGLRRGKLDSVTPALILEIEDDGHGMDARQLARAFDELHSDKAKSGLGLTYTRSVVEAHGGEVRLRSVLGQGTAVELLVPAFAGMPPVKAEGS